MITSFKTNHTPTTAHFPHTPTSALCIDIYRTATVLDLGTVYG